MQKEVFVVGLAGPSGSGKSTVAKRVAARLDGHVISMEVYSIEMNHLPLEQRAKQNYDAPNAIDVRLLESQIQDYAAGAIEAPIYDFTRHLRVNGREHIPCEVVADRGRHLGFALYATAPAFRSICLSGRPRRGLFPSQEGAGYH
jgi:uridine kinase